MNIFSLHGHITKLLVLGLCLMCFQVKAQKVDVTGVRYITLLPIITNLDTKVKDNLFKKLSKYISKNKEVAYKSHDGFYDIFRKYEAEEGQSALEEKRIIRIIGEKLLAGSLIRIKIDKKLTGYDVIFDVFSRRGKNLFHREKLSSKQSEKSLIQLLSFWIKYYIDLIPYDASVVEMREEQLLIEFAGDNRQLFPNKQFVILKQLSTEDRSIAFKEVGYGTIGEITEDYFVGNILQRKGTSRITQGDKIIFKVFDQEIANKNPDYKYRTHDLGNYRNYGRAALFINSAQVQGENTTSDFTGLGFATDLFLPSSLLFSFELRQSVGQSNQDGTGQNNSLNPGNSLDNNNYKVLLGKTFKPRSYKYISYADIYAGWSVEQLFISGAGVLAVGDVSFTGPIIGFRLEHPIYTNLSAISSFEYSISPRFEERRNQLGEASSTSGYTLQLGARYLFKNSGFSLEGTFRRQKNSAEIQNSNFVVNATTTQFLFGGSYFF